MAFKFRNTRLYLRYLRRRRQARAWRLGRKMSLVQDNSYAIHDGDVVAFVTIYNERHRIAYFLDYYRKLGISHFVFIDNNSNDGSLDELRDSDDITIYQTDQSYRRAHYGMDWVNYLLNKYGHGRWCLTIDIDEFLVYPHNDKRPIAALVSWLEERRYRSLPSMLIDLYPNGKIEGNVNNPTSNPFDLLTHFDTGNYSYKFNKTYRNVWIQGGVRARLFFRDHPDWAPSLNKIPLIKWDRQYVYVSSTHQLLPRHLNRTHSTIHESRICGALLHTKFLPDLQNKVSDPYLLSQHYSRAREYQSYNRAQLNDLTFVSSRSKRYHDWQQLERLGIISRGGWA